MISSSGPSKLRTLISKSSFNIFPEKALLFTFLVAAYHHCHSGITVASQRHHGGVTVVFTYVAAVPYCQHPLVKIDLGSCQYLFKYKKGSAHEIRRALPDR